MSGGPWKVKRPVAERFWEKVNKDGPAMNKELGSCWLWTSSITGHGYGYFWTGAANRPAHLWLYEHINGVVPPGLELDHLCAVKPCVRPSHIEAVTHRVNCIRADAGANMRIKTHCPRGHEYDEVNTYIKANDGGRDCRICTRRRGAEYRARFRHAEIPR